jgi:starvation-inducible DNA-binding protein
MNTQSQLQQVFADNFVAYYRSHVSHVNIQGRNFYSDHKLLGKIYEDLNGQIDTIAELLRSLGEFMPGSLDEVLGSAQIATGPVEGKADTLLADVRADLDQLRGCYEELIAVADADGHVEISNYAQDRVLTLAKYLWMLDSTLDEA